jgi:hypothetical protein
MPGVESTDDELSVPAGPEIVDPVAAASNMALRVLVRMDGAEESGVLRIRGHLLGSPAARDRDASELRLDLAPEPDPELDLDLELPSEQREDLSQPDADGHGSRGLLAGLLSLVLVCAAGIGAWQLGWLDQWISSEISHTGPVTPARNLPNKDAAAGSHLEPGATQDAPSPPPPGVPAQGAGEIGTSADAATKPPVRGVQLARAFLAGNPEPQAIHGEAERQEQAGDCDAAMVLYNRAAQADTRLALALARRFDPQGFDGRGCIETPDAINASVLYEEPAASGDPAAQRRLGQLLIEREASGPLFEDGIRWLSRAAQAGDQEAKELLVKLDKP